MKLSPIHRSITSVITLLFFATNTIAQNIPVGTWRTHLSYTNVSTLAITTEQVYAASTTGLFAFDPAIGSSTILSKIDGLSDTEVNYLDFNTETGVLLIAYRNGNIDIVENNTITNISDIVTSAITQDKQINHIYFAGNLAYLSTNFGVVIVDVQRKEIKETYRNLGMDGNNLAIYASTISSNRIFLATAEGVLTAPATGLNLLDYNNWERYTTLQGLPATRCTALASLETQVYAGFEDEGVYVYANNNWQKLSLPSTATINHMQASNNQLLISVAQKIITLDINNTVGEIIHPLLQNPQAAAYDQAGKLWVADSVNGLVSNYSGDFQSFIPNSPFSSDTWKLINYDSNILALSGGYGSPEFLPFNKKSGFYVFTPQGWVNYNHTTAHPTQKIPLIQDVVSATYNPADKHLYIGSFGEGLLAIKPDETTQVFNASNSPLQQTADGKINITGLATDREGNVWMTNFGAGVNEPTLYVKKTDNSWQSYLFANGIARRPTFLLLDDNNFKWMPLAPPSGGIWVFDEKENRSKYLSATLGQGGLPSNRVNSLAKDKEGQIWVGTDRGVALFFNPFAVFEATAVDALTPIYERRPLLNNEVITSIAVDGGNRKWIGTRNGLWLFNGDATELISHFTAQNSPLLSNTILDIAIQAFTGEVFVATDKGIVSYRGTATEGEDAHTAVKVFPNPVRPGFTGLVGISGLVTNAIVKITDINGRLVYETQAQGGTAVWNVKDYTGRRAATGIYLIFSADAEGNQALVSKMAVIE